MKNPENKHDLFVISGPSGVGKGTILEKVLSEDPRLVFSTSATTRPPRPGEENGVHYFFIDKERFQEMIKQNEFLEHAFVHQNHYGTPRQAVENQIARERDVVLDIDVQGALQVMKTWPGAVFIFIAPPGMDPEVLYSRLTGRSTEDRDKIEKRLKTGLWEMEQANFYDYVIFNDQLDRAVEDLQAVIRASRLRVRNKKSLPVS